MLASFELAVDDVGLAVEGQYGDLVEFRVNDPVFGDTGLGIFLALFLQIAAAVFVARADDLHHQIGTLPVFVGHSVGMFRTHEQDVGLADTCLARVARVPHEENFAKISRRHERM